MPARKPVVLTSGQYEQLQSGDSIDGVLAHPGFVSGSYYSSQAIISVATGAIATGQIWYYPFAVPSPTSFDRIAMQISTASVGGGKARLAIFDTSAGDRPANLLLDSGELAIDSTGLKEQIINSTLDAGRYMLAATISAGCSASSVTNLNPMLHTFGFATLPTVAFQSVRAVFAYGAFPQIAPAPVLSTGNPGPLIALRKT